MPLIPDAYIRRLQMAILEPLLRARLLELGMVASEVELRISEIRRDIDDFIDIEQSPGRERREPQLAAGPVLAALPNALLFNHHIKAHVIEAEGDPHFVFDPHLVFGEMLVAAERQAATIEGQTWCDECTSWHPMTPHFPPKL